MSLFNNAIIGASGQGGYRISRSVRLRSSASAYFNRTPASAGNRKTWTWSGWVKLGSLSTTLNLMYAYSADSDSGLCQLSFQSNQLRIQGISASFLMVSTPIYRDPTAWYHIVYKVDTKQATAADRVRVYVNGVQITAWATNAPPPQNTDTAVNNNVAHNIGRNTRNSNDYLDGYLTEINLIDGQALTPSSFGETNSQTGVWQPKRYAGTYGTNGFYLNFSDNSGVTATTIGKDYSGNGNNWTPNNISITAGATYDSMLDVPTPYADGGNGRGNYAVLNPLNKDPSQTTSDGNLTYTGSASLYGKVNATIGMTSGKWYWEGTLTGGGGPSFATTIGIATSQSPLNTSPGDGGDAYGWGYYSQTGNKYNNGTSTAYGATYTSNDVIGVAFDADAGTLTFYKNGTTQGTAYTGLTSGPYFPSVGDFATTSYPIWAFNFGQRPFAYTPPTGFVALNTQNLPTPTISNGALYMAATTYTGTGSALTIANTVGSASFQPDLVWVKGRSGATDHAWYDAVRGVQLQLESNTTTAETTETTGLTAFGSTGFTVGALAQMNTNAATYVAWQWNAGGSTVTNTSGSISAQVRANATAGFSVVTYTGNATNGASYGHGLGVAPSMVITKARSGANDWATYHVSLGSNQYLFLNQTAAAATFSGWLTPSANVNTFTNTSSGVNTSGATYVAYCFAAVAGYSAFGSYTGNGSADGPFVFTNFRPRWVMIKASGLDESWFVYDSARNTYNVMDLELNPNNSGAEATFTTLDFVSNGFKIRNTNSAFNTNGATYIFAAFAEVPFKSALGR